MNNQRFNLGSYFASVSRYLLSFLPDPGRPSRADELAIRRAVWYSWENHRVLDCPFPAEHSHREIWVDEAFKVIEAHGYEIADFVAIPPAPVPLEVDEEALLDEAFGYDLSALPVPTPTANENEAVPDELEAPIVLLVYDDEPKQAANF